MSSGTTTEGKQLQFKDSWLLLVGLPLDHVLESTGPVAGQTLG